MTHDTRMPIDRGHSIKGGVAAGLVGGAVLAVWLLLLTAVQGGNLWVPLKMASFPLLGPGVMEPGFDLAAVLLGVVCHFLVSAGWGVLFGVSSFGLGRTSTILMGLLWGVVAWIGMYYFVLPITGAQEIVRSTPVWSAIVTHLIFGLTLGLAFLPFQRTHTGRRRSWREHTIRAH